MDQIDDMAALEAPPCPGDGLLRHGPDRAHSRRCTPPSPAEGQYQGLHAAAWRGDVQKIEKLAAAGANLNARDPHGRTPLHVASFARQRGAIRALVKAGADINLLENDRYDGVTIAAVADDEETLRVLLSLGASAKHHQPLRRHGADRRGAPGPRRRGAPADRRRRAAGPCEQPALDGGDRGHRAGRRRPAPPGHAQGLLDAGASVKLTDRQGQTPLQLARARGYKDMVKMLETAGAK
jgi:ankyrin repeat protein